MLRVSCINCVKSKESRLVLDHFDQVFINLENLVEKNTKEIGEIKRNLLVPTVFWEHYPLLNTWSKWYSTSTRGLPTKIIS